MIVDRRKAMRDRRGADRISAVFAVKSVVGRRVQLGQSEDVGPGGMTLRRPRGLVLRTGTPMSLTFELPEGDAAREVVALGVVVSDTGTGSFRRTGVRFTHIHPEHQEALASFCSRAGLPELSAAATL